MHSDQQIQKTEQIWRDLSDRLRQFVQSRVSTTEDVDDILQTVFLRIHSRLADLRNVDRLEAWVFQITRNVITDHFRKKRPVCDGIDVSEVERKVNSTEETMPGLVSCLGTMIERLPNDQRRAVTMYELEGVPQNEIASRESISVSGAKSRIQRGRKSLEAMLKACCEFQFDSRGNVLDCETNHPNCCNDSLS